MVQREKSTGTTRLKLVNLLPRLRRFAAVLAGDREACDSLLRNACQAMLADDQGYQRGTPFDRWAFAQLYACWLEELRDRNDPMAQGRETENLLLSSLADQDVSGADISAAAEILAKLPPQQRAAALLIYGDGFSYDDAALILDAGRQTVIERASRALTAHIVSVQPASASTAQASNIESLFPRQRQAS